MLGDEQPCCAGGLTCSVINSILTRSGAPYWDYDNESLLHGCIWYPEVEELS